MIKSFLELPKIESAFTRDFCITTQSGYGLSTVIGFIKYQLATSKVKLVHEKMFTHDNKYIYSIYSDDGSTVGRVVCYTDQNRFDIFYDISSLFSSGFSINNIAL